MIRIFTVIVQPKAKADLDKIHDYIAQESRPVANEVLSELIEAIESLRKLPARFRPREVRKNPTKTIHCMVVTPYLIFYRIVMNPTR